MTRTGLREMASVARVLASGRLGRYSTRGQSRTERFEVTTAGFLDSPHTLAVSSGTAALMCALVGVGVGPGDEVLVPAYTWVSTAAAALALGAVPVLVEVDESLTLDPDDMKTKITGATRAVVPVHMLNLVCDMDAITALAAEHGIAVVEDACQAFGVRYRGRRVGTIGNAGAFSFSQSKNISAGEGGLLATADERVAVRAGMFHDVGSYTRPGWVRTDEPLFVGMNLKMSELASSVLLPQVRRLDAELDRLAARRRAAIEELTAEPSFRVSPHHAPEDAVALTVTFDDPSDAERFSRLRGAHRLIDTGRHVHLNWESVRGGRTFSDRFDPYLWARRAENTAGPDSCPATVDILARTCRVRLRADLPVTATRILARRLAGYR
jgi:dTDP-4-amino-4,6-dideoxygalactose transaminase